MIELRERFARMEALLAGDQDAAPELAAKMRRVGGARLHWEPDSGIATAETFYRDPNPDEPTPLCFVPARYMTNPGMAYRLPRRAAPGEAANAMVQAVVDHGRWIVTCPENGCGGAQVACDRDRRFLCNVCLNARHGGKWIKVAWPGPKKRQEIERLLMARPDFETRSWWGEDVKILLAENIEHGLEG
jgi:hypothetical protein